MKLITSLVAMSGLSAFAIASSPVESRALVTYKLKAVTTDSRYNGLFLNGYHTGAGFNAVVLDTQGALFYTNGTNIRSNIEGGSTEYPFSLGLGDSTTYDNWYPASLNAGDGSDGFLFTAAGDLSNSNQEGDFYGWLVCKWALDLTPQVFNFVVQQSPIPSNCAKITIVKA